MSTSDSYQEPTHFLVFYIIILGGGGLTELRFTLEDSPGVETPVMCCHTGLCSQNLTLES